MNNYLKKKILFNSSIILTLPIIIAFINLQIIQYKKYERLSGKNSIRSIEVKAPRGIIYDRHSNPLADNLPTYNLEIIPVDIIDKKTKK